MQFQEQQVLNVACPDKHPNEQVNFNGTTNTASEMINPAQVLLDSDQFSNLVNGRPIASVPPPPNSERPHTCKWCGKSFKTITHMKQHVACVHEKKKIHKCPHCGKMFARTSDLNRLELFKICLVVVKL